jgi:hypothetical protein
VSPLIKKYQNKIKKEKKITEKEKENTSNDVGHSP